MLCNTYSNKYDYLDIFFFFWFWERELVLAFKAWTQSEFWIQMRTCWIFYDHCWLDSECVQCFPHHLKRSKIGSLQEAFPTSYFWCTERTPFTNIGKMVTMYTFLLNSNSGQMTEERLLMRNLLKILWTLTEYF